MASQQKPLNRAADDWNYHTHATGDIIDWFSDKGFASPPISVSLTFIGKRTVSATSIEEAEGVTARFGGRLVSIEISIEGVEPRAPKILIHLFNDRVGSLDVVNANAVDAEGFCQRLAQIQGRSIPLRKRLQGWVRVHKTLGISGAVSVGGTLIAAWVRHHYGL